MKIATLPDVHTPYNINLNPIWKYLKDFKPDVVQLLGDVTSAESCNHWKIKKGIKRDVETVNEDYAILKRTVLDKIKKTCPKAKIVYHIGNHEKWFYDAMLSDSKSEHMYGIEDNVDCVKYNMEVVPFNGIKTFGHLNYMHGIYCNQYHAAKTALNYRKCIVYGHVHDVQEYMIHSPIDERDKVFAKSIACLCDLNPSYNKSMPNRHTHGFHIAYIRNDGTFNDYTIIITDGKFTAPNGKTYK